MNILILAYGSGGDVLPAIGIGRELRGRGHRVSLVSNSYFESAARAAGLEFVGSSSEADGRKVAEDPDLWNPRRGFRVLFNSVLDAIPETYRIISDRYIPGDTLLLANFSVFGARLAQEKLGIPLVTLHLQPVILRSINEVPGVVVPSHFRPFIRPLRRVMVSAVDRWAFDPVLVPRLNQFRRDLGLPPVSRVMKDWIHSPQMAIGLFPEWFAPRQPDWPPQLRLTGFPLFDRAATEEMPPELSNFLQAGEPPLVFTLGTGMLFAKQFFETSVEICLAMGKRGILLTGFPEQIPHSLPPSVKHFDYVPFSTLLPRTAALVHHGGIGTISQAIAAGIPQFVTPFNFDQPDNAARLRHLGVGDSIRPRSYRTANVVPRLKRLTSSPEVAARCRELAAKIKNADALQQTCVLIESLACESRPAAPLRARSAAEGI